MKKTASKEPTTASFLGENTVVPLTVPWELLKKAYDKVLTSRATSVQLPGFRKGKSPRALVEDALGKEKLYDAALQAVLPDLYEEAVKKANIVPLIAPQISIEKAEEGKDWILKAETAVAPEVHLGDYQAVAKKAVQATEKDAKEENTKDDDLQHIYAALITSVSPKVAPILLQEEVNRQVQQLVSHLSQHKTTLEEYIKNKGQTEDHFRSEITGVSLAALQLEFILRAIALDRKLTIGPEDFAKALPETSSIDHIPGDLRLQLESVLLRQKVSDALFTIAHEA